MNNPFHEQFLGHIGVATFKSVYNYQLNTTVIFISVQNGGGREETNSLSKSIPTHLSIMFSAFILQETDNPSGLVCLYMHTYFTGTSVHIDLATFCKWVS